MVHGHNQARQRRRIALGVAPRLIVLSAILLSGCANQADLRRAEAHSKMGYSFLLEQQLQPAFVEFQKALELNPKDRDAHYALGHIYFLQERFPEAEREFKRAIELDERYPEAWNYLGTVYIEEGKTDLALNALDRALSFPQYATPDRAQYNKGRTYLKLGQKESALRAFTAAMRINPNHALAAFEAGRLYADRGDVKAAIEALQATVQELPNFAEAHYHLAKAYEQAGMTDHAREAYRKVVELAPGSQWAKDADAQLSAPRKSIVR